MGWKKFFRRRRWDEERAQELSAYLEIETAENIAHGMSPADAAAAAHRKLGNTTQVREEIYRMNSLGFLETLWQDLRYGARMLRKKPGFTLVAALTLAIGIGANTAIFSMADWLLLRQLPVERPKEVVYLAFSRGGPIDHDTQFSFPEYQQLREQCANAFTGMAATAFGGASGGKMGPDGMTVEGKTQPVQTFFVTGNFFSLLGLKPALGRFFTADEGNTAGKDPIVVLSWEYWRSRFSGNTAVIGQEVAINGRAFTIVGVAPKGFLGPAPVLHMQAYLPLGMLVVDAGTPANFMAKADARPLLILARLKPGGKIEDPLPTLKVVGDRLLQQYKRSDEKIIGLRAVPLRPPAIVSGEGNNPLTRMALMFLTLGGLVLVLACVNVVNLLLVRATTRQGELAMRAALGAARSRMLRQLLTESLLLAFLGCAGGIGIGLAATRALASASLRSVLPLSLDLHFDWRIFGFAFAVTLMTGVAVGIIPALRASKINLNLVLHDGNRTVSRRQRLRNVLVAAQVAGALTLLIVAGLFVRSLRGVERADLGFNPGRVTNFTLDSNQIGYPDERGQKFFQQLLERVRVLPGVESASLAAAVPMGDTEVGGAIDVPGFETVKGQPHPSALYNAVSTGYLATMQIPLLRGRDLAESDSASAPRVALINQAMAEKYWPGKDPIGRLFAVTDESKNSIQIVGIVRNFRMEDPFSPIQPAYFVPLAQHYFATQTLQIRTAGDAGPTLAHDVGALVEILAPSMPVYNVQSMTEALHGLNGLLGFELAATLTGVLGGLGLILAIVGVYGVMSYSISQRTQEIGIRMALGAQRGQILGLVGKQGFLLVAAGLLTGALLAFAVGQIVQEFLVGVGPADPLTYLVISLLLAAVAMAACFVPVRRAVRINPIAALRNE